MLKAILYMLLGTQLMLLMTTWIYQKVRGGRDDEAAPALAQAPPAAPAFTPPTAPIEMRLSVDQIEDSLKWAIGLVVLAWVLFTGQEGSWWRVLAWPAGVLAVPFAAWSLWDSWNEQGTRVVADHVGLSVHDRAAVQSLAWSRVANVRMIEVRASTSPNSSRAPKHVRTRDLVFVGANDAELLKLRLPLRPAAAGETFLASLPVWTGRPIEVDRKDL